MRIVSRAIFLIAAAILVLFSVSNRESVSVALWPLPFLVDLPLYLLCFLCLMIGGMIGGGITWATGHRHRRELRSLRRRIGALERELTATQSRLEDRAGDRPADHPVATPLPAVARQLSRIRLS